MFSPLLLVALLAAFAPLSQPAAPPLPTLVLDSYPQAAREAIARAHREATAHPSDGERAGTLGNVLQAWEQWDAAHEAYKRAQALAPDVFGWHYLDAVVFQRQARPLDAAAQLKAALSAAPTYLPAQIKLAEALLDGGKLDESQRLFSGLTSGDAAPAALFGLGRIAAAQGRHEAAVEHFQRAIAFFPEFGAAHYAMALSYRALGRRDYAQAALDRHGSLGARWPAVADPALAAVTTLRDDSAALLQRGVKLADAGVVDAAITAHEAALAKDPTLTQAHANLISLYGRQRNFAKAEEHYLAVVALGAYTADAHYDYGVILGLQQRWDDAKDAYTRAIALNTRHAEAHNNLGQIFERTRKFTSALSEYSKAVESRPTLRVARFNVARMHMAQGRTEEAITELALLTEPRDAEAPRYLFGLSVAHVRAGRRTEGLKWAVEARDLALKFGDTALVAAIEADMATIR